VAAPCLVVKYGCASFEDLDFLAGGSGGSLSFGA